MKNISENISYLEATESQTSVRLKIDNTPNLQQIKNMEYVAKNVFQKIRKHFDVPIKVSSFFRNKKLNAAVKGSKTSQHMEGKAIDIQGTGKVTNAMIFEYVKHNLEYDQLIWEFGTAKNPAWVHVSLSKLKNRKQIIYIKS